MSADPLASPPDASSAPPVLFVFPKLAGPSDPLLRMPPPTPDSVPERLIDGVDAWVLQTYLWLRRAGFPARLVPSFEPGAIHVVHFDTIRALGAPADAFIVGVRGDRSPLCTCELQVVQSPALAGKPGAVLLDHWPQPGLVARDEARGTRIENIGFFGFGVNLHPAYRSSAFKRELETLGVRLVERLAGGWSDYRDLDLVLAIRALPRVFQNTKPATKLVNAWLAGCPALLGPEPGYRGIGTPNVDYLEVRTPDEVLAAIRRLKSEPELFRLLQQRGREKVRAHDAASVTRQWIALLAGPARELHARWSRPRFAHAARRSMRRRIQHARQALEHKLFWSLAHGERVLRRHESLGG